MDLFQYGYEQQLKKESPLALRLRPTKLEEIVGQDHIIGEGTLLYRAIKEDRLVSIILYGPAGCGKTTIARVISHTTKSNFRQINATTSSKSEILKVVEEAKYELSTSGSRTILFIDEIHRFNKAQQDTLLPYVEDGSLILIGATTQNPYFEVNSALLSRSHIFKLELIKSEDVKKVLKRAITSKEGLKTLNVEIEETALDFISEMSNGDVRRALNGLELAALTTKKINGKTKIDLETAKECVQKSHMKYDKNADEHYDTISAFIKSIRGSDVNASLYYLAKMLEAGEDINYISRRMLISASEDIGNADPNAIVVANSCVQAATFVGLPEAKIILSQAVIYLAKAPKSNAALSIFDAIKDVREIPIKGVPEHLKNIYHKGENTSDSRVSYKYPHDYEGNYVEQQYLPDELIDRKYL